VDAVQSSLATDVFEGRAYWWWPVAAPVGASARVHLLPAFDEYVLAYRDRSAVLDAKYSQRLNAGGGMLSPTVVVDGRVAGTWRRTLGPGKVAITAEMFGSVGERERRALAAAAERYGEFLERDVRLEVVAAAGIPSSLRRR
jgi:hypothetical protein